MQESVNLTARLEGGLSTVEANEQTISYRYPTGEQISAVLVKAKVDQSALSKAAEDKVASPEALEATGRMARAYEFLGGYCIMDVEPRPTLDDGAPWRARDEYGLITLSDAALVALDPMPTLLGKYLFDKNNVSDEEGKD